MSTDGPLHPVPKGMFENDRPGNFVTTLEGWDVYYDPDGGGYGWYWLLSARHISGLPNGPYDWRGYYRPSGDYCPGVDDLPSEAVRTFVYNHHMLIS